MTESSRTSFFTTLRFQKKICRVVANSNCILIEPISSPNLRTLIPLNQMISITCYGSKNFMNSLNFVAGDEMPEVQALRFHYAVPVGKYQWKMTSVSFFVPEGDELLDASSSNNSGNIRDKEKRLSKEVQNQVTASSPVRSAAPGERIAIQNQVTGWISNVNTLLRAFNRPKKLLVFINPFGGKRKGPQIYRDKVEPVFHLAGIRADVVMTERANHARDHLQDISTTVNDYDGVVCVGGDGMFSEMVNGMIVRTQLEQGVNYQSAEVKLARPGIPIGVIPAGSTDAVAFGVTGVNDPTTCAIHVVFGKTVSIDVSAVHDSYNDDRFLRYVTSVLGYGFLADVLLESEKNRWMGPKRYDWAGFKKLCSLKSYAGEIKLRVSAIDGSPRDSDLCQTDCALCAKSLLRSKYSSNETSVKFADDPSDKPPSSVLTIRGRFLSVNAATMACRCDKSRKGLSPAAHLGNGCSDLIVVSECSRLDYIRFLMRTGFTTSQSAFDLPFVDVYRVTEFSYRPVSSADSCSIPRRGSSVSANNNNSDFGDEDPDDRNNGVWNCDGEVIDSSAIRVVNHCQLLPVFGVGLENRFMNRTIAGSLISSPMKNKKQSGDVHIRRVPSELLASQMHNHETGQQQHHLQSQPHSPTHIPLSDVSLIITPATPNIDSIHVPPSLTTTKL